MEFRELQGYEIECRTGLINENGLTLLLYKTARTDSDILDETVGSENWQNKFYECKGNLYCTVGIKCADGWIWKDDCGSESNYEKEKGEASDAFKRACATKWGIGKALYSSPLIWVKALDCNIKKNNRGALECKDKFYVKYIEYAEGKIIKLLIRNQTKHKDVYAFNMQLEPDFPVSNGITLEQMEKILLYPQRQLVTEALNAKGVSRLCDLTYEEGQKFIQWIERKIQGQKEQLK